MLLHVGRRRRYPHDQPKSSVEHKQAREAPIATLQRCGVNTVISIASHAAGQPEATRQVRPDPDRARGPHIWAWRAETPPPPPSHKWQHLHHLGHPCRTRGSPPPPSPGLPRPPKPGGGGPEVRGHRSRPTKGWHDTPATAGGRREGEGRGGEAGARVAGRGKEGATRFSESV